MSDRTEENDLEFGELPIPVGWRMLVRPAKIETKTAGGIILADSIQDANKHLGYVGQVMAMGELCYTDTRYQLGDRVPKPWCKVGDFVAYGQYSGQKIKVLAKDHSEHDMVFLNDDEIKAVVPDPKAVRAYV